MNRKNEIKEELKEHSPFLSKLKEEELPFKVPDRYFQNLQAEVLRQVKAEEAPAKAQKIWLEQLLEQIKWWLQPRPALALASMVLLVAVGLNFLSNNSTATSDFSLADLSEEEIRNYVSDNLDEFDLDLILQVNASDPEWELNPTLDLKDAELEQYLDEIIDEIEEEDLEDFL